MNVLINRKTYGKGVTRFWSFLASDLHIGNRTCDYALIQKEFKEAIDIGADIYIAGDVIDLIIPSDKKRASRDIHSEDYEDYQGLINIYCDDAIDKLTPYVNNITLIGCGNHEVSLLKHNSFDAMKFIVRDLNKLRDPKLKPIVYGGYSGFIIIRYANDKNGAVKNYIIYYSHGQGSTNSEVTGGTIDLQRKQNIHADLIWLAHKHKKTVRELDAEIGVSMSSGRIYARKKFGVITGCYNKIIEQYNIDVNNKTSGYKISFSEERMRTPEAQGGVFIRHDLIGHDKELESKILI